MVGEKNSAEGSLDSLARAPPPLCKTMPEEAVGGDASVECRLEARGVASVVVPPVPSAPGSGAGPSVPAAPPAVVFNGAHLWTNPTTSLQAQQCIMLLERELDLAQQAATTFRAAFEGASGS